MILGDYFYNNRGKRVIALTMSLGSINGIKGTDLSPSRLQLCKLHEIDYKPISGYLCFEFVHLGISKSNS